VTTPMQLNNNELAADRNRFAAERTLMAWVRTAISMIGFGFTLYKFLEFELSKDAQATLGSGKLHGPRNLGIAFIGMAVLSLTIASVQHYNYMRRMGPGLAGGRFDLALLMAGIVSLIGILAFANVMFRVGPF
jgi:putative membrane protein